MSLMHTEILAAPKLLSAQLLQNSKLWQAFAQAFKKRAPTAIMTVARGSSDHAATYAKYLFETELGLVTASAAPSMISIYHAPLQLKDILVVAISQSGQSPDVLEVMRHARAQGALTLALVNDVDSPLATLAEYVLPLHASAEHAVAATKSFLLTLSALLQGVALIKNDVRLLEALAHLPEQLQEVFNLDVAQYLHYFSAPNALVLARGFGFSIAQELALKFKEVTQIHGEAFSSAEVLHGPFSLFKAHMPVLALTQDDLSLSGMLETLHKIQATGIEPLILCPEETLHMLSTFQHKIALPATMPLLTPLLACAIGYLIIEALAVKKHLDPDHPPLIQKITRTH